MALLAHGAALGAGWVLFDDREMLLEHGALDDWGALPGLFARDYFAHAGQEHGMYRPLALVAYFADRRFGGDWPFHYHLTNWLLHAATAVAVAALAWRAGLSRAPAVLAGAVFAALPVHAETVGWVVGRCDGIATLGAVTALAAHLAGRPWAAAGCFLVGLLGKESAAAAVPLAGLLAWGGVHPAGADRGRAWRRAGLAAAVACGLYALARVAALDPFFPPRSAVPVGVEALPLLERIEVFGHAAARMWGAMALGLGLCADHSAAPWWRYPGDWQTTHGLVALALAVPSLIAFVLAHRHGGRAGERLLALGLCWPLVAWLPVSQLVPLKVVQADRFCSLASVGFALALAAAVARLATAAPSWLPPRAVRAWAVGLGALLCATYAVASWRRAGAFHDPASHALDVLRRYPYDAQAWNRLGIWADELGDAQRAEEAYRNAVRINDHPEAVHGRPSPSAAMNLGTFLLTRGRHAEAREWLERAAAATRRPGWKLRQNLAHLYTEIGEHDLAVGLYRALVRDRPADAASRLGFGTALAHAGRPHEAAEAFGAALELVPDHPDALLGLAEALLALGEPAEAAAAARRVLATHPGSERARRIVERAGNR